MTIVVAQQGSSRLTRLNPRPVRDEGFLQRYFATHPEVLPLDIIREGLRLLPVAKEFPTRSGPLDVLALDDQGVVWVVETKLYRNPDKRLVVAQILDYAAALWSEYSPPDEFVDVLRTEFREQQGKDLDEAVSEVFGLHQDELEAYWESVRETVEEGQFSFVVLMDRLDDRLRDLIGFLNQKSQFFVYGVELTFYEHQGLTIIVPRLYGAEGRKDVRFHRAGRRPWNERSFFEQAAQRLTREQMEAVRRLYTFCQRIGRITWGTGVRSGSFNPKVADISPRSIISVFTDGRLQLNFGWISDTSAGEQVATILAQRFQEELGVVFPKDFLRKYPVIPVDRWTSHVDTVIAILDQAIANARKSRMN